MICARVGVYLASVALVGFVTQMRMGDIGFVQPFRYSFILWATLLGIIFFGHWPDHWTVAGAAIVAGCGITSLWREQRRSRQMLNGASRLEQVEEPPVQACVAPIAGKEDDACLAGSRRSVVSE